MGLEDVDQALHELEETALGVVGLRTWDLDRVTPDDVHRMAQGWEERRRMQLEDRAWILAALTGRRPDDFLPRPVQTLEQQHAAFMAYARLHNARLAADDA